MRRVALACVLMLTACGHDLRWEYTLPAGLEGSTLIGRVRAGGCSGREIRFEAPFVDGMAAPAVPRLGAGAYGVEIEVHDATCRVVGRGCTDVTLPRDGAVRVTVAPVTAGEVLCGALLCTAGVCAPSDAGTMPADAGSPVDTGPPIDSAVDAPAPMNDASMSNECTVPTDCPCSGDTCTGNHCVPPMPATAVSAGDLHACAIAGGGLFCWGTNTIGEVGVGYSVPPLPPRRVGVSSSWSAISTLSLFTLGLDGTTVRGWGSNYRGQTGTDFATANLFSPTAVTLGITADRVRAGGIHGGVLDASGQLWAFGDNVHAQALGAPTTSAPSAPTRVGTGTFRDASLGTFFSCGITSAGVLQCWGADFNGELGSASTCTDCGPVPVVVPSPAPTWARVELGIHTGCAWDDAGALYCWGANTGDSAGAVGVGTAASDAPEPTRVSGIAVAEVAVALHACAIDLAGALWCWGPNTHGQLGDGSTTNRTRPTAIAPGATWSDVDVGAAHTCAIRADGNVFCWGKTTDGATGTVGTTDQPTPTRVCLPFG